MLCHHTTKHTPRMTKRCQSTRRRLVADGQPDGQEIRPSAVPAGCCSGRLLFRPAAVPGHYCFMTRQRVRCCDRGACTNRRAYVRICTVCGRRSRARRTRPLSNQPYRSTQDKPWVDTEIERDDQSEGDRHGYFGNQDYNGGMYPPDGEATEVSESDTEDEAREYEEAQAYAETQANVATDGATGHRHSTRYQSPPPTGRLPQGESPSSGGPPCHQTCTCVHCLLHSPPRLEHSDSTSDISDTEPSDTDYP